MRIAPPARIIRFILIAGLAALLLGFLFMWSGLYTVAASRGHWAVTEWVLTFAMRNSVKTHALGIEVPPLGNADLVTLGAAHFHSGCAYCHGAPGIPISPVARAMLPPPPDLATNMRTWRDRELFWIIKHGIKYTGMPAWSAQQRDDEVWALAAFLRRLPRLDAAQYRDLALGGLPVPPQSGQSLATSETMAPAVGACARCHGAGDGRPASSLVPILHGQPAEFIIASLQAYTSAQRASGIMQPVARALASDDFRRVADYYAALKAPPAPEGPTDASAIARGRTLAENGDPAARIPACAGCHGNEALKTYPRLAGQNLGYLLNRLRLWKNGLAPGTAGEAIMAPIARALSERQIEDVAAYYASGDPRAGGPR
ncbi:c-type cytochrome [Bradyrhizobium sp. LjRoot220]|uniref:c-type cytochrome n=1 Tax=Bradyrhizobium sp. LjRoot220 TaxID=3342284 RepID=UPI003ECD5FA1